MLFRCSSFFSFLFSHGLGFISTHPSGVGLSFARNYSRKITPLTIGRNSGQTPRESDDFLQVIARIEADAVIPPRSNRKQSRTYDKHLYKERHLVECYFNKIKHYRRIFSRFEKLDKRYLGFLCFVGVLIWLR